MAVAPVCTVFPETTVAWPTRTPWTSVMALSGPGGSTPGAMPRSRARTWSDSLMQRVGERAAASQVAPARHRMSARVADERTTWLPVGERGILVWGALTATIAHAVDVPTGAAPDGR